MDQKKNSLLFLGIWFLLSEALCLDPAKPLSALQIDHWNYRDGLPGRKISHIDQTPDGNLWIGADQGLFRFDGHSFVDIEPLSREKIWGLETDNIGTLWIATHTALWRLNGRVAEKVEDIQAIQNMVAAEDGRLLIATWFGLVERQANGRMRLLSQKDGLETLHLRDVTLGHRPLLASTQGLVQMDSDGFQSLTDQASFFPVASKNGKIWFYDFKHGLMAGQQGRFEKVPVQPEAAATAVTALFLDKEGMLWVGHHLGLTRYREGVSDSLGPSEGIGRSITAIFEDGKGMIWLGNQLGDLYRLRENPFQTQLPWPSIGQAWYMAVGSQGEYWIFDEKTLFHINSRNQVHPYAYPGAGIAWTPQCVTIDKSGEPWVGTVGKGAWRFGHNGWSFFEPGGEEEILQILFREDDEIWIVKRTALEVFQNHQLRQRFSLAHTRFETVASGRDQRIWVGTDRGLGVIENDRLHFPAKAPFEHVNRLYFDEEGTLWILAGKRLGLLGENRYHQFEIAGDFEKDWKTGLIDDLEGNLWVGSEAGLFKIRKSELLANAQHQKAAPTVRKFGIGDGMVNDFIAFGASSLVRDAKGWIWTATHAGVTFFNPAEIVEPDHPPEVFIDSLTVDDRQMEASATDLSLTPGQHRIALRFGAVDLVHAGALRFRYRVSSLSSGWVEQGKKRDLVLSGLPSGEHHLDLAVSYHNQDWREYPRLLRIVQRPYFHQTTWFFFALIGGILLLTALGWFWRTRHLRNRAKELKLLVLQRTESLRDEKEKSQRLYHQLRKDHMRKTQELQEAKRVQLAMLPQSPPNLDQVSIGFFMKTATEVGGDYYDFFEAEDGALTLAIGDATGHGMKAGLMVATTKSYFRFYAGLPDLIEIAHNISQGLRELRLKNMFFALCLVRIRGNQMSILNAGMPACLHRDRNGQVTTIQLKGLPLGGPILFPYRIHEQTMSEGESLLLMSDGLEERFNTERELLGQAAICECFQKVGAEAPETTIKALVQLGEDWSRGRPQDDDLAMIALRFDAPT